MPFDQQPSSITVGSQRLLILADFLERNVPADKFDMDDWEACSGHWATTVPELKALGLRRFPRLPFLGIRNDKAWAELVRFFGDEAMTVFETIDPNVDVHENTPMLQAARIREFVERRNAER